MNRCNFIWHLEWALGEVTIRPLAEFQNFVFETVTLDSFLFIIIDKEKPLFCYYYSCAGS